MIATTIFWLGARRDTATSGWLAQAERTARADSAGCPWGAGARGVGRSRGQRDEDSERRGGLHGCCRYRRSYTAAVEELWTWRECREPRASGIVDDRGNESRIATGTPSRQPLFVGSFHEPLFDRSYRTGLL